MRKDYCDITMVLDRSHSMSAVRESTISGVNEFVEKQKNQPGYATFSLVQFDDEYEVVYEAIPVEMVTESTLETFVPRGMTALLDAIGRTINRTGQRLNAMPEYERPDKVVFVIVTDGHENVSKEFNRNNIFEMIRHQDKKYDWEFVFIGANQDAIATATSIGILADNSVNYAANDVGTQVAFSGVANSITDYRSGNKPKGQFFNSTEKAQIEQHVG